MRAAESREGFRYVLPRRFGERVIGIQYGFNHTKEWVLFLLEAGKERKIRTVMPNEELGELGD